MNQTRESLQEIATKAHSLAVNGIGWPIGQYLEHRRVPADDKRADKLRPDINGLEYLDNIAPGELVLFVGNHVKPEDEREAHGQHPIDVFILRRLGLKHLGVDAAVVAQITRPSNNHQHGEEKPQASSIGRLIDNVGHRYRRWSKKVTAPIWEEAFDSAKQLVPVDTRHGHRDRRFPTRMAGALENQRAVIMALTGYEEEASAFSGEIHAEGVLYALKRTKAPVTIIPYYFAEGAESWEPGHEVVGGIGEPYSIKGLSNPEAIRLIKERALKLQADTRDYRDNRHGVLQSVGITTNFSL